MENRTTRTPRNNYRFEDGPFTEWHLPDEDIDPSYGSNNGSSENKTSPFEANHPPPVTQPDEDSRPMKMAD